MCSSSVDMTRTTSNIFFFYSSFHFGRCVHRWLVRPILARKVLLQLGQGRLSPGSTVLALSFLVSLLSSATRERFSSQFTAPLCVRERQPGLSVTASSQVSGFMLKDLREAFKVSLNHLASMSASALL